ncbi:MAG: lysophospholipid acyltransferase family protein [Bacteroidota bacterium]
MARNIWAKAILYGMGCLPLIEKHQKLKDGGPYFLVANHSSMLDIALMLYVSKIPFAFVGKQELAKIPVFGFFYSRTCILVDRENAKSRASVYTAVQRRLERGISVAIFPEGGVPEAHILLDRFKDGAFRMAIAHTVPIIPMVFLDCKQRFPWDFFKGSPGPLRVVRMPLVATEGLNRNDVSRIKESVRNGMLDILQSAMNK